MDWGWERSLRLELPERDAVLGLDIGSSTIKIVQLRRNSKGYVATGGGLVNIANSGDRRTNTVRAIHKCVELSRVSTKLAVCSVCGPEVAIRDFKFPALPAEEIEGAVLLEASQVCPFNIEESAVDYHLIPTDEGITSGVLVAATKTLVKNKIQLAKYAGLDCVLMDVDGLALLNCFSQCEELEPGHTIAILNVGGSYATLAILGDNGVPFVRDIAYAGDDIITLIAEDNDMSTEAVKEILSGDSEPEQKIYSSLEKACDKLIIDVTKTSQYYKAEGKPAALEKIFVCGGFAQVKGFVEILNRRLPVRAALWNPFEKIKFKTNLWCRRILKINGPAMAVAAGLAMRTI